MAHEPHLVDSLCREIAEQPVLDTDKPTHWLYRSLAEQDRLQELRRHLAALGGEALLERLGAGGVDSALRRAATHLAPHCSESEPSPAWLTLHGEACLTMTLVGVLETLGAQYPDLLQRSFAGDKDTRLACRLAKELSETLPGPVAWSAHLHAARAAGASRFYSHPRFNVALLCSLAIRAQDGPWWRDELGQ